MPDPSFSRDSAPELGRPARAKRPRAVALAPADRRVSIARALLLAGAVAACLEWLGRMALRG